VRVSQGFLAEGHGALDESLAHFQAAGDLHEEDWPPDLEPLILTGMGGVRWALGQYSESLELYRRVVAIQQERGDRYAEASAMSNVVLLASILGGAEKLDEERLRVMVRELADLATRAGNRRAELTARLFLAQDASRPASEILFDAETALDLARRLGDLDRLHTALRLLARCRASYEPERLGEALALLDESLALARSHQDRRQRTWTLILRSTIFRIVGRVEASREDLRSALAIIEELREIPRDDLVRARFLASWNHAYDRLAWELARGAMGSGNLEDIREAFSVTERRRARALLDVLDAAGAGRDERRELAGLESVQAALGPGEALLAYQVADRQGTGLAADREPISWGIALTRDEARVFPIPGRAALERSVRLYLGLLERRDALAAEGGAALYRALLREALDLLPAEVETLIVVPDGILHRLPFGALRPAAERPPLAAKFALALAPSATTWLRWRRDESPPPASPLLALADPVLGDDPDAPVARTRSRYGLGSLPHARREAREISRALGGQGTVRTGVEASESFLKGASPGRYGVLHLAAHAVVDEAHPERSAVLLAPGSAEEDGLLKLGEIADLDLRGRAVLLSACRSASGALLEGEGIMGLSHGFFQAGSRAVLGGLWPLRDDETADLVTDLARHLARGSSLGEALATARRERIEAGAPTASWAGLVLVGDGSFRPVNAGMASGRGRWALPLALSALAALTAGFLVLSRLRRR
jgi:CHAT domain-containing protein